MATTLLIAIVISKSKRLGPTSPIWEGYELNFWVEVMNKPVFRIKKSPLAMTLTTYETKFVKFSNLFAHVFRYDRPVSS